MKPSTSMASNGTQPPKEAYRVLKKRFKFLVYENECYQEEIRNLQRKLLKLSRDKNFLLDRLLPNEKLSDSSDDSDASIAKVDDKKGKKPTKSRAPPRRRAPVGTQQPAVVQQQTPIISQVLSTTPSSTVDTPATVSTSSSADNSGQPDMKKVKLE